MHMYSGIFSKKHAILLDEPKNYQVEGIQFFGSILIGSESGLQVNVFSGKKTQKIYSFCQNSGSTFQLFEA
jgi:hypothetical protein